MEKDETFDVVVSNDEVCYCRCNSLVQCLVSPVLPVLERHHFVRCFKPLKVEFELLNLRLGLDESFEHLH